MPPVGHPGIADGPEEDRIELVAKTSEGLRRQRLAGAQVMIGTVWELLEFEIRQPDSGGRFQNAPGFRNDLRADSITPDDGDAVPGQAQIFSDLPGKAQPV